MVWSLCEIHFRICFAEVKSSVRRLCVAKAVSVLLVSSSLHGYSSWVVYLLCNRVAFPLFGVNRRMFFLQAADMSEVKTALYQALLELMKLCGILYICSI